MKFFYTLLLLAVLSSCNITGKIKSTELKAISYGTGGGFTNQVKTYTLLPDGAIWLRNSITNDSLPVKRIPKNRVYKLYGNALKLGIDTLSYSKPGNTYSFITIVKKDGSNKIVWDNLKALPGGIITFVNELKETVKK